MGTKGVYVAGEWTDRDAVLETCAIVREEGHRVCSTWHDEEAAPESDTLAWSTAAASREQIAAARALVAVVYGPGGGNVWMAVEAARLRGLPVMVICDPEHVPMMAHAPGLVTVYSHGYVRGWLRSVSPLGRSA